MRPACIPPACRLVRPWKTIITSLPRVLACSSCPLRSPSPAATIRTIDTIPHAIPNMVRNARNLCAHKVRKTSRTRSCRVITTDWTGSIGERHPRLSRVDTLSETHLLQKSISVMGTLRGFRRVLDSHQPARSTRQTLSGPVHIELDDVLCDREFSFPT